MSPSLSSRPLPPRMSSPQLVPAPLPSPPVLPRRSSHMRLHLPVHPSDPPIPPSLIGSPLLHKLTSTPRSEPQLLSQKVRSELWIDGDEFGTRRLATSRSQSDLPSPASSTSSSSSKRGHRRSSSIQVSPRSRSRSPPPTPHYASPPPPVPPIPSFALATPGARRSVLRSQPVHHKQITIPNLDFPPLSPTPPSKRNRCGSTAARDTAGIEHHAYHRRPRPVAT